MVLSLRNLQDPNKPKRAMSAFFLYSQANRTRIKEENPEAAFGDIVSPIVPMECQMVMKQSFGKCLCC